MGAAGGVAAGLPLGWLAHQGWLHGLTMSPFTGRTTEVPRQAGMPGRFPGRVVEVRSDRVVNQRYEIDAGSVRHMMERGMQSLVGTADVQMAWQRFFERDDVVGIKVNPVGRRARANEPGRVANVPDAISSPEVIVETVRCLHEYCGIPKRNIILFERYADEFREAGYERLTRTRPLEGCRWLASATRYNDSQLDIDGHLPGEARDPNVVGYDPDQFVSMGFAAPDHNSRDDRRFRSHLSMIVSRLITKMITIPVLKDHKSAGVTIALKNMSHGMNNNVARSHISGIYRRSGATSGPNQCNTFIPTAVAQRPLMEKATLHIMDGLIAVYEGGPGNWNRSWGYWPYKGLFFATDPVAMDHVGWDIIDAKRLEMGWLPVARMGLQLPTGGVQMSPRLAALAALGTPAGAAALVLDEQRRSQLSSEPFDRRQPEHIALAGLLGLGKFNAHEIEHRVLVGD